MCPLPLPRGLYLWVVSTLARSGELHFSDSLEFLLFLRKREVGGEKGTKREGPEFELFVVTKTINQVVLKKKKNNKCLWSDHVIRRVRRASCVLSCLWLCRGKRPKSTAGKKGGAGSEGRVAVVVVVQTDDLTHVLAQIRQWVHLIMGAMSLRT